MAYYKLENFTPLFNRPPVDLQAQGDSFLLLHSLGLHLMPVDADFGKKHALPEYTQGYRWNDPELPKLKSVEQYLDLVESGKALGLVIRCGAISNNLAVIDIDSRDIEERQRLLDFFQGLSPTDFVVTTPSGGVHLYYFFPESYPSQVSIIDGVDFLSDGRTATSLGTWYQYTKNAEAKGVPRGHYGSYKLIGKPVIPMASKALVEWVQEKLQKTTEYVEEDYSDLDDKEALVLSLLDHITANVPVMSYEEWLSLWMSAYQGSGGSGAVLEYLLESDNIHWSDGEYGKTTFRRVWDNHTHRNEGGYTIGTLIHWARTLGWGTSTGHEVQKVSDVIKVQYISDWLKTQTIDSLTRICLMSQTGSGKTRAFKLLWERLNKPKSVIIVPTRKLAVELANSLTDLPVTCYLADDQTTIKNREALKNAHILITTLQTYTSKVKGQDIKGYGLVYLEESDQILKGYALGANVIGASHVTDKQAREGFIALHDIYQTVPYVWAVDASMSSVTTTLADAFSSSRIRVVKNTYISKKADVTFVRTKTDAINIVAEALIKGLKTVVIADTRKQAHDVIEIMKVAGLLHDKKHIVITSSTAETAEVVEILTDVNTNLKDYDLVVYNSVMGSGVNIDAITPDAIIQFSTFLSPRHQIQLLNRFRTQDKVFCYYRVPNIQNPRTFEQIREDDLLRVRYEALSLGVQTGDKTLEAQVRDILSAITKADEERQRIDSRMFYYHLLSEDGRTAHELPIGVTPQVDDTVYEYIQTLNKERKERLRSNWITIPPLDFTTEIPKEYTREQIVWGKVHNTIKRVLDEAYDRVVAEYEPEKIYDVVTTFKNRGRLLTLFYNHDEVVRRGLAGILYNEKALATFRSNVIEMKTLKPAIDLYPTFDGILDTVDDADTITTAFQNVNLMYYNILVGNRQKVDKVEGTKDMMKVFKVILARAGLKLKSKEGGKRHDDGKRSRKYYIDNKDDALLYLDWVGKTLDTDLSKIETIAEENREALPRYLNMSPQNRANVSRLMVFNDYRLKDAVDVTLASVAF